MSLPNVSIELLNNQLGSFEPSADRVMGLICGGVAADELGLGTSKAYFSLAEVEADGITETYDSDNGLNVWKNISDFYTATGPGAELWLMLVAQTNTMAAMCLSTNDMAKQLIMDASGRICVLGVTRVPDGGYEPSFSTGFDDDVAAARTNAQALGNQMAAAFRPLRFVIDGRDFQGDVGDIVSAVTESNNRVVTLMVSDVQSPNAAVGKYLGDLAAIPPQRKVSRVANGPTGWGQAFFTDGSPVEFREASWNAIHDKGFTFVRKFVGKAGYFWTQDRTACPGTDDYKFLARGRVIDKAARIAYQTFVDEIEDDVELDESGFLNPAVAKGYAAKIERAIRLGMAGEITDVKCDINPAQDVLGTDLISITKLGIIPFGYASFINVPLGFSNPQNV
jgi:Protein of unknown function (DUF2586)